MLRILNQTSDRLSFETNYFKRQFPHSEWNVTQEVACWITLDENVIVMFELSSSSLRVFASRKKSFLDHSLKLKVLMFIFHDSVGNHVMQNNLSLVWPWGWILFTKSDFRSVHFAINLYWSGCVRVKFIVVYKNNI